jgi:hypothetical protein
MGEMLIRAALVGGLPTHSARRKLAEIAKLAAKAPAVADAFSADSVVDFAEFFVIEEPFRNDGGGGSVDAAESPVTRTRPALRM